MQKRFLAASGAKYDPRGLKLLPASGRVLLRSLTRDLVGLEPIRQVSLFFAPVHF